MTPILPVSAGCVTFWKLSQDTIRQQIVDGWTAIGQEWGNLAPAERTAQACLKEVLSDKFKDCIIRPLQSQEGFAVLRETRFKDDVITSTVCAVATDDNGVIDMRRGYDPQLQAELEVALKRERAMLKPAQVASGLVAVLKCMTGTLTLRPTGGFYWVEAANIDLYKRLCRVVEQAALGQQTCVYQISHHFDADSIRAVRDALLTEIDNEAEQIIKDVDSGELGERALKSRAERAEELKDKVAHFERILNESLSTATQVADKAGMTATAARLLATAAA